MTDSPRHTMPATRRLWVVLVLLVGLLGMHGLASDHAAMAAAPMHAAAAAAPVAPTMPDMAGMAAAAPVDSDAAADSEAGRPAGHDATSMAGLCLAVLAAALLLVAAVRQQERDRASEDDRLPARLLARARALPPPRPPDLVAGLCVSRT